MPAIVEVRTWTHGNRRVDTPVHSYINWENTGEYWPEGRRAEDVLLDVETFARLCDSGEITQIGSVPVEPA